MGDGADQEGLDLAPPLAALPEGFEGCAGRLRSGADPRHDADDTVPVVRHVSATEDDGGLLLHLAMTMLACASFWLLYALGEFDDSSSLSGAMPAALVTSAALFTVSAAVAAVGMRLKPAVRRQTELVKVPASERALDQQVSADAEFLVVEGRHSVACVRWDDLVGIDAGRRRIGLRFADGRALALSPHDGRPLLRAARVVLAARTEQDDEQLTRMQRGLSRPEEEPAAERGISLWDRG